VDNDGENDTEFEGDIDCDGVSDALIEFDALFELVDVSVELHDFDIVCVGVFDGVFVVVAVIEIDTVADDV
jgi:hypothetical protein